MIWNLKCNEYILGIHLHFNEITITEIKNRDVVRSENLRGRIVTWGPKI